jgi:hypothetical protein
MMTLVLAIAAALAVALALYLRVRARRLTEVPSSPTEAILLEEAIVTEPVAPGLEGKAEIRRPGAGSLTLRVRAADASQAFARGSKVRVIDLREGLGIIEGADEEHLVR